MKQQISTKRKQTYPFKTMEIGDTFRVSMANYNSMLGALRYHNKTYPDRIISIESAQASIGFKLIKRVL